MNYSILVVDDEKNIREGIGVFLEDERYEISVASSGKEAITILQEKEIDLLISDLRMSPINGEQLLQHVTTRYPSVPVIILTGHGSVETAVSVMHKGAYDFLTKPVDLDRLLLLIKRALQTRELALKNRRIQAELQEKQGAGIISRSRSVQDIIEKMKYVAPVNSSVLITGESGVGKEILCNNIHQLSPRQGNPLIVVHCAALTESLLESELFGHEKGAFTGAIVQKKGRFELADGGTIFLDEIGEVNANVQITLLRILQEQSFERVGGEKTIKIDVRIIAATNKNLLEEVEKGNFREDLYYRLSVVNIEIPPLRERLEDIPLFAQNFLNVYKEENSKSNIEGFSREALRVMSQYSWPGNIRELRNCVESAVVMTQSKYIEAEDLPIFSSMKKDQSHVVLPIGVSIKEGEKEIIHATLVKYNWNKSKAAEILGIGRKTLHNKIKEYSLKENPE